ncbi:MAG: alpha/beta hydrolase [Candidatus Kapaibacteriales bacterium]
MAIYKYGEHKAFYEVHGDGEPLLMLHGNSVSSKMFKSEIDFWLSEGRQVIVTDYIGLGQSSRLEFFADDYWYFNSQVVASLLDELNISSITVVGTSGGALTGLNLAVNFPEKVKGLIADSFMGYGLSKKDADAIASRRTKAKEKVLSKAFWKSMNGEDWETVVDHDIDLMRRVGSVPLKTIHGDVSQIKAPVLCVGSHEDELIPDPVAKIKEVAKDIPNCEEVYFDYGKHPFMITQKPDFRKVMKAFLEKHGI